MQSLLFMLIKFEFWWVELRNQYFWKSLICRIQFKHQSPLQFGHYLHFHSGDLPAIPWISNNAHSRPFKISYVFLLPGVSFWPSLSGVSLIFNCLSYFPCCEIFLNSLCWINHPFLFPLSIIYASSSTLPISVVMSPWVVDWVFLEVTDWVIIIPQMINITPNASL